MLRGLCLVLGTDADVDKGTGGLDRDLEVKTEKKKTHSLWRSGVK